MKDLVNILKQETKGLKDQFVSRNLDYAKIQFEHFSKSDLLHSWVNKISGKLVYAKIRWGKTRAEDSRLNKMVDTLNMGLGGYLEKVKKDSINHYDRSILKLADRISEKGLDLKNLTVKTSHVGVNIDTTLTDGKLTVRAYTIIAGGEIQRPHYRYLIK